MHFFQLQMGIYYSQQEHSYKLCLFTPPLLRKAFLLLVMKLHLSRPIPAVMLLFGWKLLKTVKVQLQSKKHISTIQSKFISYSLVSMAILVGLPSMTQLVIYTGYIALEVMPELKFQG